MGVIFFKGIMFFLEQIVSFNPVALRKAKIVYNFGFFPLTLLHSERPKLYTVFGFFPLSLLHSEMPKLYTILAILSAKVVKVHPILDGCIIQGSKQETRVYGRKIWRSAYSP